MAPLNHCKEWWRLDPTRGPGREEARDNVCQQTLTGLYHNELSVLEERKGLPANRPPRSACIPTGQGSGLHVCHVAVLCEQEDCCVDKNVIWTFIFGPFSTPSSRFWLTLCVTCHKLGRKALFAVITAMTIWLPLSKPCDKSQTKSNIWCGGSQRGERSCLCVFFCKWRGSFSAAWVGVRVYSSRTERGIKFHAGMKGFSLLTNDIWGEGHTKSSQDDSTSVVRLAWRHLFILFMTWEFRPRCLFKCFRSCCSSWLLLLQHLAHIWPLHVRHEPLCCSYSSQPTDVSLPSWLLFQAYLLSQ